jgi:exo-beta-1,3-glucanase (GH17 family)
MYHFKNKKVMDKRNWHIMVILLFTVIACNYTDTNQQEPEETREQISDPLQQSEDDLLAGISKAICYSGFRSGQHPDRGDGAVNPSYDEILEDMIILSKEAEFKLLRLYDSKENSEMVLKAIKDNDIDMKVLLGIWLDAELSAHETCEWLTEPIPEEKLKMNKKVNLAEIERGIMLANQYQDIVVAVNVGNESLVEWNDHMVDTDTIISYVKMVQQSVKQPVTVADNYKWWALNGQALSAAVDFISIHVYPVWEGKGIDEGLSYSIENIKEVRDSLPEATIVITELGWPTVASEFPEHANEVNQKRYYQEIMDWTKSHNITTFFFEAFDEDWKGNPDNPLGAEKHWGLYTVDREPKLVMQ